MPVGAEQPAEGVFHGPSGGRVHVTFDGRQVNDVLADEIIGDMNTFGVDIIQGQHLGLGPIGHPCHVIPSEVVEHWNIIVLADWHIAIQVFALESIGDDRLVLHAHQIGEARLAQGQDGALQLPGGSVGTGHRIVPGDVVFEDGGRVRIKCPRSVR